jgi:hypothetical protein
MLSFAIGPKCLLSPPDSGLPLLSMDGHDVLFLVLPLTGLLALQTPL